MICGRCSVRLGKGAEIGEGSGFGAGRAEAVKPRQAGSRGAEAADATIPLRAAKQKSGRDGTVPVTIAVWLRVRLVFGSRIGVPGVRVGGFSAETT